MEFNVSCENLSKGLYRAQGIVEKRAAMPILSNVLVEAKEGGTIKLTASDMEVGMTCSLAAEVKHPGSVAVGAKILYEIVKNLKKQKVTVRRLDNNWAEVKSGASEYRLLGMPVDDFQKLPELKDIKLVDIDSKVLRDMIEKTLYSASTDETRYSLNGCYIEKVGSDGLRMVATDGHRLCLIDRQISGKSEDINLSDGIIIPRKGLLEVKRLLESEHGNCRMGKQGNNVAFEINEVLLVIRLIDGKFPDYKQVIPKEQKINVELGRKEFLECLRRVSVFTLEKVGIRLQLTKGSIRLLASNPDIGEAKEEIAAEYKGSAMTIGLNARYLDDALSAIDEENVIFSFDDDLSPCTVRAKEDNSYKCVIMPMRI